MSIKKSILVRIQIAMLPIGFFALAIIYQVVQIQFVQGKRWEERARQINLQYKENKATRGNVYAAGGEMLATSVPLYRLAMDPMQVSDEIYKRDLEALSQKLSDFFEDKSTIEYLRQINDARAAGKQYIVLNSRYLTFLEKKEIAQWPIFREGQFQGGVIFEKVEERTYPFKDLAKRTIGFINENDEGAGIEKSFNKQLAGQDGRALYQRITGGEWKPVRSSTRIRPVDGYDIYTTIDINVQDVVQQTLEKALIQHRAKFGCAIVMEVKTGEIKAIANLGKVEEGEYAENYNYSVGDQSPARDDPGSTFKTVSMTALFEDTTLTLTDTIETGGGTWRYYDRVMRDDKVGGWGTLTVQQAFEFSSNIGISKLISRHFGRNPDELIAYLRKFGLAASLESIQLEGKSTPYIKDTSDPTWSGVSLPWMSVGYEMKVSPLQILTFYNAIANGGVRIEPLLVKQVARTGQVIASFDQNRKPRRICSQATVAKMQTLLRGVVERGTARKIKSDLVRLAGKTGTSQKLNDRGRYTKKYKASFAGYFPANAPKYSCIVVIDEPQGADQYGGDVSAPVFKQIAEKLFSMDLDIQSTEVPKREAPLYLTNLPSKQVGFVDDYMKVCQALGISVESQTSSEIVSPQPRRYAVEWQERNLASNQVPNVKGLTLRDALYVLENRGLKVFFKGQGRVKTQSLMPGAPLKKGEKIVINLE